MTKTFNIKYDIAEIVYLVTDTEQKPRIVISINIRPNDILYELALEEKISWHNDFEIVKNIDLLKKLGIDEPVA
jgi:hypothetical protein